MTGNSQRWESSPRTATRIPNIGAPSDPWIYWFGAAPASARCILLCLPCAGGSASMYANWATALPADISLAAVRLPGREARLREPAFERMEDFVAAFLPTLARIAQRPYALFGHSMGALMAYALMRALPAEATPPHHLFLSAHRPPHLDLGRAAIAEQPEAAFLKAVQGMGGLPEEVTRHSELLELILPTMRADFRLCENYPRGELAPHLPRLEMPVTLFGGGDDPTATPEALQCWSELCDDLRATRIFPGSHFYLRSQREALLGAIAAALAEIP